MRGVAKSRKKDEVAFLPPLSFEQRTKFYYAAVHSILSCPFLNAPTDVAKEAGGCKEKHKKQSSYARSSRWRDVCEWVCVQ